MPSPETYRTIIENIARTKSSLLTVFADFCKMSACALAMGRREDEYLEVAKRYSRDELSDISRALALLVQEMESKWFQDILGPYYLDIASHSAKQARGEFYTPPEISKLMAMMSVDAAAVRAAGKPITVNDPACGAGGMLLAVAELFAPDAVDLIRVAAQDINPVAVDMAYINLTLWGVPARVILGDTIRQTVTAKWENLHWFRVGEDKREQFQRVMDLLKEPEKPEPSIDLEKLRPPSEKKGQFLSRNHQGELVGFHVLTRLSERGANDAQKSSGVVPRYPAIPASGREFPSPLRCGR